LQWSKSKSSCFEFKLHIILLVLWTSEKSWWRVSPEIHVKLNPKRCHRKEGEEAEQGSQACENTGWKARLAFLTGVMKTEGTSSCFIGLCEGTAHPNPFLGCTKPSFPLCGHKENKQGGQANFSQQPPVSSNCRATYAWSSSLIS